MAAARPTRTGLLGGTFDPIHEGHLDVAEAARVALALDEVWLVPSRIPPHRMAGPFASVYHRFQMVALAARDHPGLVASDFELRAPGPSYTSATLQELAKAGFTPWQLFFVAGADAFMDIATWRDYPDVLDRAHFVVVSRPGVPVAVLPTAVPALASRMAHPGPDAAARLDAGGSTVIFLVDATTTNVSSTEIRTRAAEGRPLSGLVPASVDQYIRRHRLYSPTSSADDLHD